MQINKRSLFVLFTSVACLAAISFLFLPDMYRGLHSEETETYDDQGSLAVFPSSSNNGVGQSPDKVAPPSKTKSTTVFKSDLEVKRLLTAFRKDKVDDRNYEIKKLLSELGPDSLPNIRETFEAELNDSLYMREWEHFLKWWVDFAPADAMQYAASDFDGNEWHAKHLAGTVAAEKWLKRDPLAASEAMAALPEGPVRDNIMAGLGQEYAIADLDGAMAWVEIDASPEFKSAALFGITYGAVRNAVHDNYQPEVISKTAGFLNQHADEPYAAKAVSLWVSQVVREDSPQALDWVNWAVDLPQGHTRSAALQTIFDNAKSLTPSVLEKWMQDANDVAVLESAAARYVKSVSQRPDESLDLEYLDRLARAIDNQNLRESTLRRIAALTQ